MTINKPGLSEVGRMPDHVGREKVWKHFYCHKEQWGMISACDVPLLRKKAEDVARVRRVKCRNLPKGYSSELKGVLDQHHVDFSAVYMAEMHHGETIWSPSRDITRRQIALTPGSVFIVVEFGHSASCVVTAFRPHPPAKSVLQTDEDFRRHGLEYFKRKRLGMKSYASMVATNLRTVGGEVPSNVTELWWLASAVGYGRLFKANTEVAAELGKAELVLESVKDGLIRELGEALEWDVVVEEIEDGLLDDRPEDLEEALAAAEELLAVGPVLGEMKAVEQFWGEFEQLIAWIPAEWGHIGNNAMARLACLKEFSGEAQPAALMWDAVSEAVSGALLRETEPVTRPRATLVDELLPMLVPGVIERWSKRLVSQLGHVVDSGWRFVESLGVVEPSRALSEVSSDSTWKIKGQAVSDSSEFRVFVVGVDCSDGYEVTEQYEAGGEIWELESVNQSAMVILFAATTPIGGGSLEEVLESAVDRGDVIVETKVITRPR